MRNKAIVALVVAAIPGCAGMAIGASPLLRLPVLVVVSYTAFAMLLGGICLRVLRWSLAPVPFRIPVTCGQQKSLVWIRAAAFDNPSSGLAAAARMGGEVLFFRSLFRNTRTQVTNTRAILSESRWLWLGALAFHWSLLLIVVRHLRFMVQPVPAAVVLLEQWDSCFQTGIPSIFLSDIVFTASVCFLLWRRVFDPAVRYVSLIGDYLALWLLTGVAGTGMLIRHIGRVDVAGVKQFALGLATFSPNLPATVSPLFFAHLFMVCALVAYIPCSKLMHMGGVWLSPTRNLANNSRAIRHLNPWNSPVKTHNYAAWESEYRDKLQIAGIPMEDGDAKPTHSD